MKYSGRECGDFFHLDVTLCSLVGFSDTSTSTVDKLPDNTAPQLSRLQYPSPALDKIYFSFSVALRPVARVWTQLSLGHEDLSLTPNPQPEGPGSRLGWPYLQLDCRPHRHKFLYQTRKRCTTKTKRIFNEICVSKRRNSSDS